MLPITVYQIDQVLSLYQQIQLGGIERCHVMEECMHLMWTMS